MLHPLDGVPCPDPVAAQLPNQHAGLIAWVVVLLLPAIFELWALLTGHQTMTQALRRAPRWFRWLVGASFVGLLLHLFL